MPAPRCGITTCSIERLTRPDSHRLDHRIVGCSIWAVPSYPDFVTIARGFGIEARQIRKKSEATDALKEMIASPGAYVLDVLVPYQEHVLPMIPAGATVRDIIKS